MNNMQQQRNNNKQQRSSSRKLCKDGAKCQYGAKCRFAHPERNDQSNAVAVHRAASVSSTTIITNASARECRNGAQCSRPDCRYSHPASRQVAVSDGAAGNRSGVDIVITEETVGRRSPPNLGVTFVVDVSGSMDLDDGEDCTRLEAAVEGMVGVFDNVLERHDRAELITFATEVHRKHFGLLQKQYIDIDVAMASVANADRGCTALWDAIKSAIDTAPRNKVYKGLQRELVVLTDGDDNNSSTSLAAICALVAKPGLSNFHLVVIGVGLSDSARRKANQLCSLAHCTFLDVAAKPSEIQKAFQRTQGAIIKRRKVHVKAWAEGAAAQRVNPAALANATVEALDNDTPMMRALMGKQAATKKPAAKKPIAKPKPAAKKSTAKPKPAAKPA